MRVFKSCCVAVLLCSVLAQPQPQPQEPSQLSQVERDQEQGSYLAHVQHQLLARKYGLKDKSRRTHGGYSLESEMYGGLYTPSRADSGRLSMYTGQTAVRQSIATESIQATSDPKDHRVLDPSDIEPVTVRSHPWEEMIKTTQPGPALSSLFSMAPQDSFAVYFREGSTIGQLEKALDSLLAGANVLFNFQQSLSATEQIARRLGVENFRELEPLMGETIFVSEDLNFYPGTHYALIFKGDAMSKIAANLLVDSKARGRVGEAFVLASSEELFKRIEATSGGEIPSLAEAQDLAYCNAVLDQSRDGFCYFSESFIVKLVSPQYRVNSARRLAAMDALVERQYVVLAYRTLTGVWPKSFAQMVEEGYRPTQVEDGDFLIHPDGQVEHKVWGGLHSLKALSEVLVERVSESEKKQYEDFRRGYDRLWTRFFDPVGVAFEVSEQLRFHTIILPLVNSREYNILQLICGGDPLSLQSLGAPLLSSPASLHMRLNSEDILLMLGNGFQPVTDDQDRAELKAKSNASARRFLKLDESFDLFAVFGDELCLSYGPDFRMDSSWSQFDVVVSLELQDRERFQELMRSILKEPERQVRTLQGIEYVDLTFESSSHVYAVYQGDFVHITVHEPSLKRLCQQLASPQEQPSAWFDSKWVGDQQNVLFRADLRGSDTLLPTVLSTSRGYARMEQMKDAVGYMVDRAILEKSLGVHETKTFLRSTPTSVFGVPCSIRDGEVYLGDVPARDVAFVFSKNILGKSRPTDPQKDGPVSWSTLVVKYQADQYDAIKLFEQTSVGLSFTPEGLSTRVSINNPTFEPTTDSVSNPAKLSHLAKLGVVGGAVVLFLGSFMFLRRRTSHQFEEPKPSAP
jgi:hypothetical protein